jgi:NRPS condensation-like uncharacterized protein
MQRQLGIDEHIIWLYTQEAPIHFTLTAKILGELHIDELQQAITAVQQKHPLLRVRIVPDLSNQPWFIEDSTSIPLRIVKRWSEQQWLSEVEQELLHSFDWSQAPLIRMVLLHGLDVSELIITCHHSIGDGMSMVYLLKHILQVIGIPDYQQESLPKRPPLEYLTPELIQKSLDSPKERTFEPQPQYFGQNSSHTKPNLPEKSRLRLVAWSLSPEETAKLISRCRQQQTSVHAAICAAFLLAIFQQKNTNAQKHNPEQVVTLKCLSPINIRRFLLKAIQEDFGCYFTLTLTANNVTPDLSLWDLARSIKSQLNQKISSDQIFAHLPDAQAFVSLLPSASQVKDVYQKTYDYDVFVSNLGRLNIPTQYGTLQLAEVYGPFLQAHMSKDRVVGVTTLGDQMFFSLVYLESNVLRAQIELLQKEAMQLLLVTL